MKGTLPIVYTPDFSAVLPDPDGVEVKRNLQSVSDSIRSLLPYVPVPATKAPAAPLDGMVRLSRSPWRPVAGTTADAWVYYDGPTAAWKLWLTD